MPQPSFRLSGFERALLALYYTAPVSVRADIGARLWDAFVHPPAGVAKNEPGRKAAWDRFRLDTLGVDVLTDVRAGGAR